MFSIRHTPSKAVVWITHQCNASFKHETMCFFLTNAKNGRDCVVDQSFECFLRSIFDFHFLVNQSLDPLDDLDLTDG